MIWTSEDVELVEKFIKIRNRGMYADGKQLTDVYNRVLEKNVHVTSCGSCLRQRVSELEKALNKFKEQIALKNAQDSGFTTVEEAAAETQAILAEHEEEVKKEETENADNQKSHKTKRAKKKQESPE